MKSGLDAKPLFLQVDMLNKSSELWHTSVNRKARPVVEGEHDKSWNNHGLSSQGNTVTRRNFFNLASIPPLRVVF